MVSKSLHFWLLILGTVISQPEITTTSSQWKKRHQKREYLSDEDDLSLEKLLQDKSKHGVFEADFENQNGTTVTVRDGDSVVLGCRVYLLHDKTVSWMRQGEGTIDLLTVGDTTYTGDERINVSYQYPNNWRLNLTDVRKSDGGLYMCQISSFPPKALVTFLNVKDALVEIVDGDGNPMETQYYNPGSEIELTCIIRNRSHWSTKTLWLKDQQLLDLNHRPTINIGTQVEAEHVLNRLWIGQAEKSDSGNYSCTIPGYEKTNFPRARVRVHVMDGDFHAAVYGKASRRSCCFTAIILVFIITMFSDNYN